MLLRRASCQLLWQVTRYAAEHPGGIGVLLEHAGQDSTDDFEDVGHSDDARKLLSSMKIGVLTEEAPEKQEPGSCRLYQRLLWLSVAAAAAASIALIAFRLVNRRPA